MNVINFKKLMDIHNRTFRKITKMLIALVILACMYFLFKLGLSLDTLDWRMCFIIIASGMLYWVVDKVIYPDKNKDAIKKEEVKIKILEGDVISKLRHPKYNIMTGRKGKYEYGLMVKINNNSIECFKVPSVIEIPLTWTQYKKFKDRDKVYVVLMTGDIQEGCVIKRGENTLDEDLKPALLKEQIYTI